MLKRKSDMTEWEVWIVNNCDSLDPIIDHTPYDALLELAVSSYDLRSKSRKMDLKDQMQYLCLWWSRNKHAMKKYTTLEKVGELLGGKDHATVLHHINKRKPSRNYKQNTECIKDFLES